MPCNADTTLTQACSSGIGRVRDPVTLLQLIAQLTCEASKGGGGGVPAGTIVMWSGLIANIPDGWAFCNGDNGTPDLRNRFVAGGVEDFEGHTVVAFGTSQTGGSTEHQHTITDPGHTHSIATLLGVGVDLLDSAPAGQYSAQVAGNTEAGDIGIPFTDLETVIPPFYALAYIMKL